MQRRLATVTATVLAAVLATTAVAGCGGDETVSTAVAADAVPDYGRVTSAQATELAVNDVTIIDVRTPEEYAQGHIEGARLLDFSSDTFAEQITSLDPDDEYLVYCRSGNRSGQTVALMREHGIDQVWELEGGVLAGGLTLVQ